MVRGPVVNGQSAFVDVGSWLGAPPPPLDPDEAWARLAIRYLASAQVVALPSGLYDLVDRETPDMLPKPRLLGPFDPVLHGWVDRRPLVGTHRGVVTDNGIFKATALVGGRVVGTWTMGGDALRLQLLEELSTSNRRSLRADTTRVRSFLGLDPVPFEWYRPGDPGPTG